jgi:hypothetical protein
VSKVWDRITARRFTKDARWGPLAGMLNPDFLSAKLFKDEVLTRYARAFRDHAGVFVFEFQAMRGKDLPAPERWADELHVLPAPAGRLPLRRRAAQPRAAHGASR